MIVEETDLPGVLVVRSPVYDDLRGFFTETFHAPLFARLGLPTTFAQDSQSHSVRRVLRGIHYQLQHPQGKLIRPANGAIFDVAVDLRRSSSHFGRWTGTTLRAGDGKQMWIPPGFGHAFLVLSESADVTYKCTTVYDAGSSRSIRWNDETIDVRWPLANGEIPILSVTDAAAPALQTVRVFT